MSLSDCSFYSHWFGVDDIFLKQKEQYGLNASALSRERGTLIDVMLPSIPKLVRHLLGLVLAFRVSLQERLRLRPGVWSEVR